MLTINPATVTSINRQDHRPDTDCQLHLGLGVSNAGDAVYMLIWPDDDAPDEYDREVLKIVGLVNSYFQTTPQGVLTVGDAPNGDARVVYGPNRHDSTFRTTFPHAYSISRGVVRVHRDRMVVPCACNGATVDFTIWTPEG